MTQPSPPDDNSHVLATAAVALALIAVESQVRQDVEDDINTAMQAIAATAVVTASTAPATVITGIALLSLPGLFESITTNLSTARSNAVASIQAGYTAATQVALTKTTAELKHAGYDVPSVLPELGNTIEVISRDVDTMFGHAQTDIQNGIAEAFDGVQGADAKPARLLAIRQSIVNAAGRLRQRAAAAAATAVHKGFGEAQQAIYAEFQNQTGTPGLMKRWRVMSADPCGMCLALDGTMVGVNAEFDHNAAIDHKDFRPVWRYLLSPPRHPNCRCQLELVTT